MKEKLQAIIQIIGTIDYNRAKLEKESAHILSVECPRLLQEYQRTLNWSVWQQWEKRYDEANRLHDEASKLFEKRMKLSAEYREALATM